MELKDTQQQVREAFESGNIEGENRILKQILEQLLKIELIPKLKGFA